MLTIAEARDAVLRFFAEHPPSLSGGELYISEWYEDEDDYLPVWGAREFYVDGDVSYARWDSTVCFVDKRTGEVRLDSTTLCFDKTSQMTPISTR